jgi:hypothetical protein
MSAIGAAFARGVASLGGPQVAAVVVAGGLIAGGLGGAYVASQPSRESVVPAGELAVYPCPDQGPALMTVKGGQKLLATGRTEDGAWLRIHYPLPGRSEAWVQASPLSVTGAVDSLPVAVCAAEVAAPAADVVPGVELTAILNLSPTPAPTPWPTPTTSPPLTPNAKPSLTALTASTKKISYDTGSYCPTAVKKVTFKVKAGDTAGLEGVTLFWREPGAAKYAASAMTRSAGTATSGTWEVTLDTTANGITKAGTLAYYAVARDTDGATRRIPAKGTNSITVAVCANTGPAITSVSSSAGSTLYWDPQGGGCGATTTNITAAVKDIDGVKSVTLFFRRPSSSTWSSKPMNNTTVKGKWYANLDTLGDKITKSGALSWYIKAVDTKNKASQTKTASMTIRICDTTAPVIGRLVPNRTTISLTGPVAGAVCAPNTITFRVTATDPESGVTRVDLHWTNPAGAQSSRKMTLSGNVWAVTLNAITSQFSPGTYGPVYATATNGFKLTSQSAVTRFSVVKC